jgi:hypothetical protein
VEGPARGVRGYQRMSVDNLESKVQSPKSKEFTNTSFTRISFWLLDSEFWIPSQ